VGDLKYGRTTHSLIFALDEIRSDDYYFCPSPGLEVPDNIMHKLVTEYAANWRNSVKVQAESKRGFPVECCLYYPRTAAPLTMNAGHRTWSNDEAGVGALL